MKSKIYNIYFERKIPSWKATEVVPEILVAQEDPPSICYFEFPQSWSEFLSNYSWDSFPISGSWGLYDREICPSTSSEIPFWCADTISKDGGIIEETITNGTIFDDQE